MRAFISFRFTGEDPVALRAMIEQLCAILRQRGFTPYSTFDDEEMFRREGYNNGQIMDHALLQLPGSALLLVVKTSGEHSEGMLNEVGAVRLLRLMGIEKIPILLAIRRDIATTSLRHQADKIIEFGTLEELYERLMQVDLPVLT